MLHAIFNSIISLIEKNNGFKQKDEVNRKRSMPKNPFADYQASGLRFVVTLR
jgi:hypothetical protein